MTAMYELLWLKSRHGRGVQFLSRAEVFSRLPIQWRNSEMYQRMKDVPQFIAGPPLHPVISPPSTPALAPASQRVTGSGNVDTGSGATPTAPPALFKSPRHVVAGEPLAALDANLCSACRSLSPAPPKPPRALPALLIKPPPDENRSFDSSAISGESFMQTTLEQKSRRLELDSVSASVSLTQTVSQNVSLDSNQVLYTKCAAGDADDEASKQLYQLLDARSQGSSIPSMLAPSLVQSAPPSLLPSPTCELSSLASNHSVESEGSNTNTAPTRSGNQSPSFSDDWRLPTLSPIKLVTFSKSPQKARPSVMRRFSVLDASTTADTSTSCQSSVESRRPVTVALPYMDINQGSLPSAANCSGTRTPVRALATGRPISAEDKLQLCSDTLFVTKVCSRIRFIHIELFRLLRNYSTVI